MENNFPHEREKNNLLKKKIIITEKWKTLMLPNLFSYKMIKMFHYFQQEENII